MTALCCAVFMIYIFLPAHVAFAEDRPRVISEAAVLIDGNTGQVLYDKNMNQRMQPASITKILTGLLAVENGDLAENITVSHDAVFSIERGSSNIALQEGEVITLEQALYAMSIESANDAAARVGEYLAAKTGKDLYRLMNDRAKRAGANSSNFVNPHGLPDENHYTTAYDMAMIAKEAIKYPVFNRIFSSGTYEIPPTNKQEKTREFHTQNWYFNGALTYDGIIMSKTGWTTDSGHTMVTRAKRGDICLICVVLKSTARNDKWDDTDALLDWGFSNFKTTRVSGNYISLCAPEEIDCDEDGKFFVSRDDITAPDINVLLTNSDSPEGIKASYSDPVMSGDMTKATFTVTLYTGDRASPTVLAVTQATAPAQEKTVPTLASLPRATHKIADQIILYLFGRLTFVGTMIADLIYKK